MTGSAFARSFLFAALALFLSLAAPASARKWKDTSGQHTIEAELVGVDDDVAVLKKEDGGELRVPLVKLSPADRVYISRQLRKGRQALPAAVDLRPNFQRWGLVPKSQGNRNTCSVCVTTSALEYAASRKENRGVPLSVEYLNWACNQVINNSTEDRGQFFHDLLKGFDAHGLCEEPDMPYQGAFANPQPSADAVAGARKIAALGFQVHFIKPWSKEASLTPDQFKQIKTALADGWPVCAGSNHSLLLVGYADGAQAPGGGTFLVADSGSGAFATRTYHDITSTVYDAFWVELPLGKKR